MNDFYDEYMYHHGIKGMRWGIRRFQPYPKGKFGKFIGDTKRKISSSIGKAASKSKKKAVKVKRSVNTKIKEERKDRKEIKRHKKLSKKKVSQMTDEELQERIKRLQMEKELRNLSTASVSEGERFVKDVAKSIAKAVIVKQGTRILNDAIEKNSGAKKTSPVITVVNQNGSGKSSTKSSPFRQEVVPDILDPEKSRNLKKKKLLYG